MPDSLRWCGQPFQADSSALELIAAEEESLQWFQVVLRECFRDLHEAFSAADEPAPCCANPAEGLRCQIPCLVQLGSIAARHTETRQARLREVIRQWQARSQNQAKA